MAHAKLQKEPNWRRRMCKIDKLATWRPPNRQIGAVATARVSFWQVFINDSLLALYDISYMLISRKKSQKFYSLPAIKK